MALTELQMPTKANFYHKIQHAATEMNNLMLRWNDLSEFIGFIDSGDLDAMGVPTGQVRTDLNQFKTVLEEVISFFEGNSVTPTNAPNSVIDKIRSM